MASFLILPAGVSLYPTALTSNPPASPPPPTEADLARARERERELARAVPPTPPGDPAAGRLLPEALARTTREHYGDLVACLAAAGGAANVPLSNLTVRLVIDGEGRVQVADVDEAAAAPQLAACVRERFLRWSFPPPSGGVPVAGTVRTALHSEQL